MDIKEAYSIALNDKVNKGKYSALTDSIYAYETKSFFIIGLYLTRGTNSCYIVNKKTGKGKVMVGFDTSEEILHEYDPKFLNKIEKQL